MTSRPMKVEVFVLSSRYDKPPFGELYPVSGACGVVVGDGERRDR